MGQHAVRTRHGVSAREAMSINFQELDYQQTPLGELILRKRRALSMGGQLVYEVKLDNAFLMSSLINEAERALATRTLRELAGQPCDVLVGGLGLGPYRGSGAGL